MSFEIFWDKLDEEAEDRLKGLLASHLAAAKRPPFLGEVHLDELRFGAVPPEVEVLDVTDPFPEFYLPRELAAEQQDGEEVEADNARATRTLEREATRRQQEPEVCLTCQCQRDCAGSGGYAGDSFVEGRSGRVVGCVGERRQFLQRCGARPGSGDFEVSGVPRAHYEPGCPRWPPHCREPPVLVRSHSFPTAFENNVVMSTPPDSASSVASCVSETYGNSNTGPQPSLMHSSRAVPSGTPPRIAQTKTNFATVSENDAQVFARFTYDGNLRLSLRTELKVDYPGMPNFVALPVRVTVTGAQIDATAIIAYAEGHANFCFLPPEDDHGSIIKDVRIQSELGDEDKAVLKNVDKVERFIIEQLRKAIDDNLVFPSYHSITFSL